MTDRFGWTAARCLLPLTLSACLLAGCAGHEAVTAGASSNPPATPDTTPPTISSANPSNGANGVSTGAVIRVTFSEAMSASSINAATFTVNGVSGNVSVSGATATFSPSSALASSTTFTAKVLGGAGGAKDAAGNPLAADFVWTFTTASPLACASATVHCVDVNPGPSQEFTTIQAAVNAAQAGDTVLVFDGSYAGFVVSRSGTDPGHPITVKAAGNSAVVNQASSAGEGIRVDDASFVTIEGFTLTGLPAYGLAARGATPASPMHGVIFRNNTVTNSGSTNIYASEVADSLIEGNSTSNSGEHGIYLANGGSDNTVLRGNHCFNNAVNGIHLNGDASIGPGGDGLHKGITIEKNIIHGNAANGLDLDGIQDSVIQDNLIYGNGNHAARAFQIDASAGPQNLVFVNNTFVQGNGNAVLKLTQDLGGHTFFNNILVNDSSGTSLVVANASFQSNHNVVRGGFSLDGESTVISLAQWQASGHDANSLASTSAALFNSPGSDFTLKSGSPAANAGVASFNSVSAPSADILGIARPQGSAYDIGAYESF